jgi:HEAT repeat protein
VSLLASSSVIWHHLYMRFSRRFQALLLCLSTVLLGCGEGCGGCGKKATPSAQAPAEPRPTRSIGTQSGIASGVVPETFASAEVAVPELVKLLRKCHTDKTSCKKANRYGKNLVRHVLKLATKGDEPTKNDLWYRLLGVIEAEKMDEVRYQLALFLGFIRPDKLAKQDPKPGFRLIALIKKETRQPIARFYARALKHWISSPDPSLQAQLKDLLLNTAYTHPALLAARRALWRVDNQRAEDKKVHTMALQVWADPKQGKAIRRQAAAQLRHIKDPKMRAKVVKEMLTVLRDEKDTALLATSVESLGHMADPKSLPAMIQHIRRHHDDATFLASAAMGLASFVENGNASLDTRPIVQSARGILNKPGLSHIAYQHAIRAVVKSGDPNTKTILTALAKGSDKVRVRLAVKALRAMAQAKPSK